MSSARAASPAVAARHLAARRPFELLRTRWWIGSMITVTVVSLGVFGAWMASGATALPTLGSDGGPGPVRALSPTAAPSPTWFGPTATGASESASPPLPTATPSAPLVLPSRVTKSALPKASSPGSSSSSSTDTTPPVVTIKPPATAVLYGIGGVCSPTSVEFTVVATDDSTVTGVTVKTNLTALSVTQVARSGNSFTFSASVTLAGGGYPSPAFDASILFTATDAAGNIGRASTSLTVHGNQACTASSPPPSSYID